MDFNKSSRYKVLLLMIILFLGFIPQETQAFIPGAITIQLSPNEFISYSYDLQEGDGLLAWISVNSGTNVSIFILNSTQHGIFEGGGEVTTKSAITYLSSNPDSFYGLVHPVNYDDQWYVYIYNHDILQPAEIKIVIFSDKEGPEIKSMIFDKVEPLFGNVELELSIYDKSDFLRRFEVYLDNDLIYSSNYTPIFPGVSMSLEIDLPTYNYENGNHSLLILIEDQFGHISSYSQSIEILNGWLDSPIVAQGVFLLSGFVFFVLITLAIVVKPKTSLSYSPRRILFFASFFPLGLLLGIVVNEPIEVSSALFSLSFISLSLAANQGTAYLDSKIRPIIIQQLDPLKIRYRTEDLDLPEIGTKDLLGRSDILDKVRSNLRNGMSIVFGIGTAIAVWFVNYNAQSSLSSIQLAFLISAFGLAVIIAAGIIVSFFPLTVQVGSVTIDESLVSELKGKPYNEGISLLVKMKLRIINLMRFSVGIGLGFFVVANLFTIAALSLFDITHASRNSILLAMAIIPLFFVVYGLVRFTSVLFGPIILGMSGAKSPSDKIRNRIGQFLKRFSRNPDTDGRSD